MGKRRRRGGEGSGGEEETIPILLETGNPRSTSPEFPPERSLYCILTWQKGTQVLGDRGRKFFITKHPCLNLVSHSVKPLICSSVMPLWPYHLLNVVFLSSIINDISTWVWEGDSQTLCYVLAIITDNPSRLLEAKRGSFSKKKCQCLRPWWLIFLLFFLI